MSMSSIRGVGSLGGASGIVASRTTIGCPLDVPVSSLEKLRELELEPDPEAIVDDPVDSLPSEKLLELRARLFRSFPLLPLPPASAEPTGLSTSTPNCSKDLLKFVVLGCRESWS